MEMLEKLGEGKQVDIGGIDDRGEVEDLKKMIRQ
jgi:hypothetical protein